MKSAAPCSMQPNALNFPAKSWAGVDDSAKDLVRRMLTQKPSERITLAEIAKHPWVGVGVRPSCLIIGL